MGVRGNESDMLQGREESCGGRWQVLKFCLRGRTFSNAHSSVNFFTLGWRGLLKVAGAKKPRAYNQLVPDTKQILVGEEGEVCGVELRGGEVVGVGGGVRSR